MSEPPAESSVPEAPKPGRARFRARSRIKRPADFRRAIEVRRAVSDACLVLHARENGLAYPRVGITIARKVTRRAVVRNRLKRLVREVFRQHAATLPAGLDFVVAPRTSEVTFAMVEHSLVHLAHQAGERLRGRTEKGTGPP